MVFSTAIPVKVANNEMKLCPSVRDTVKVTNLAHSTESFIPNVIPARFVSKPTMPNQQSVPTSCTLDHQTSKISRLAEQREDCCTFASPKTLKSSTKIKSPKCHGQCKRIRAKLILVCRPKRSAPADERCKQPEEIGLVKSASHSKEIMSKWLHKIQARPTISHRIPLCTHKLKSLCLILISVFMDLPKEPLTLC
ncbi:unnamed protein product [Hymenolepis diminuta]|uniref:Uncharacterized protein n=1 Tax=Hymenolepis diminuta TaxID=6216 RepID=A0A564XWB0_HYMDI|nr:unnamed protein product [Hymenolepis diminuta]